MAPPTRRPIGWRRNRAVPTLEDGQLAFKALARTADAVDEVTREEVRRGQTLAAASEVEERWVLLGLSRGGEGLQAGCCAVGSER